MATLANQGVASQASFGQLGSCHIDTTGTDYTCPSGLVFVAVTCLEDTRFTQLEAEDSTKYFGTDSTNNDTDGPGDQVASSTVFPKGLTIYGRWDKIDLVAGKVVAYYGPSNQPAATA